MTVHRDIVECRRAEQALRESQELLQDYLEHSNDIIHNISPEGRFLFVNRKWRESLGYSDQDLAHMSVLEIVSPECRKDYRSALERALAGESIANLESILRSREGNNVFVRGNLTPRIVEGTVLSVRSILSDITWYKRAEHDMAKAGEEGARSVMELRERTNEISLLSDMGDMLQSCKHPEEAFGVISHYMPQILPDVSGAVSVITASRNELDVVASWGSPLIAAPTFHLEDCWALRRGRIHVVQGSCSALRCPHFPESKPVPYLCAPLSAHGEVLGVIHFQCGQEVDDQAAAQAALPESVLRVATTIADRVSLALAIIKMHDSLRQQTIRDPLTNLFNRRYMQESLEREVRRAARSKRPLGVIMLDIDHFKNFNDSFGHHAGDLMLREFSKLLTLQVRSEDIICRYGGEEFILILPEASLEATHLRAEQVRKAVSSLTVVSQGQSLGGVTISVGVAGFPEHGETTESLMRAVDQALYRAKADGRNLVVIARSPKDRPTIAHINTRNP